MQSRDPQLDDPAPFYGWRAEAACLVFFVALWIGLMIHSC